MFYIDLNYEKQVESLGKKADRFDLAKFLEYSGSFHEPLSSYLLDEIRKLPLFGSYKVTVEEGRPDLIAYKVYGQVQLWWVFLHYNALSSTDQIVNSMTLQYPSMAELERLYYTLPGLASA